LLLVGWLVVGRGLDYTNETVLGLGELRPAASLRIAACLGIILVIECGGL